MPVFPNLACPHPAGKLFNPGSLEIPDSDGGVWRAQVEKTQTGKKKQNQGARLGWFPVLYEVT
jgi:hypothetical protein